jgi:phage terminase small subunit
VKKELTDKERLFVAEYRVDSNSTQAAIRAGYTDNEDSARTIGSRLYAKVHIKKAIYEDIQKLEKKTGITAEKVVRELWKIVKNDLRRCYDENGALLPIHRRPNRGYGNKISTFDRIQAAQLIGKHLKMFTDKIEVSGKVSIAERIKAGRERAIKSGKPPGGSGNPTD